MSSSVRLSSVDCLSVTFVRTQAIEIFGNGSTPFGTLAIDEDIINKKSLALSVQFSWNDKSAIFESGSGMWHTSYSFTDCKQEAVAKYWRKKKHTL